MTRQRFKQISDQQAAYLQLLIADRNADSRKHALETIAKLYRSGERFRNPERILPHIAFLCKDEHEKVRRWAFNALALVGTRQEVPAIIDSLDREANNPDVLAAVIVALSSLASDEETRTILYRADLPLEGFALLAAAQQNPTFSRELAKTRVDIDKASVSDLRLATLLLGLRKAPEHMLSDRFLNRDVIGALNFHPDELVSQYSVWAAYEDPGMHLDSLRIKPKDLFDYHPGIRKYGYRLMTETSGVARKYKEYILNAVNDTSREAREGLAAGVRCTFFNGIEHVTLPWFADEETDVVRNRLLEHMAAFADRCDKYTKPVTNTYERLASGSLGRARLEAAAAGTTMYQSLKRLDYEQGMSDLFGNDAVERKTKSMKSVIDPQSAKILIVTALPKEAAAVVATFDEVENTGVPNDPAIYRIGRFISETGEARIALTVNAGIGKVMASTLGANALRSFPNVRYVVMVGIAGGCPNPASAEKYVRLGDIVVSRPDAGVMEYDFIKQTAAGAEIRKYPQAACAWMSSAMSNLLTDAIAGKRPWEGWIEKITATLGPEYAYPGEERDILHEGADVIDHPAQADRLSGKPRVVQALIGSADILQKDPKERDKLRDTYDIRAIEMEASGLQNAAWAQGRDIYVIRGICDYCDEHKDDAWQNYAANVSASMARVVIETMPMAWL